MRRKRGKKNGTFSNLKRITELLLLAKKHKLIRTSFKMQKDYQKGISPKQSLKMSKNLKELGTRMKNFFHDAGPTFIKFGQLLSLQIDVLPREIYQELEKLQDNVPSFPFEAAKKTIESELDSPIEEIFDDFGETPVAAASLAQVHKAKLKNGNKVAVKVIRPNIDKIIDRDISMIKFIFSFINLKKINLTKNHLDGIIREFEDMILHELDFKVEGRNMYKIGRMLKNEVKIPKVYPELTTSNLLIMEWIDCAKITDLKKIKKWGLEKKKVISKVIETYLRQILIYGLYHADPHPANLGVTKKGKIVIFDFGAVGSLSQEYRKSIIKMTGHMMNLNSEDYLKEFLKANKKEKKDIENYQGLIEGLDDILEDYNKSVIPDYNQCMAELTRLLNKHNARDIHKFVSMVRTMIILGSITKIYGFEDLDALKIFSKVSKESLKNDFWKVASLKNAGEQVVWLNKYAREFLSNPKDFLEENAPKLNFAMGNKDDKKSEKERQTAERKYRSFGLYKYPFFALIFGLTGLLALRYFPTIEFYNYSVYNYAFILAGITFLFAIFNFMYLDFILDRRIEIYKYPFFAFLFGGIGLFLAIFQRELYFLNYPVYLYVFGFAVILALYSTFHLVRILKYKITEDIGEELERRF